MTSQDAFPGDQLNDQDLDKVTGGDKKSPPPPPPPPPSNGFEIKDWGFGIENPL